ncbi:MAG: hypothetical protein KJ018_05790 [Burkholderiales bacterium]|nr:hypothetical protein [Burkholderiales bacterium]
MLRQRLALAFLAAALLAAASTARARDLIEYYHAGLDHYFLTGFPQEVLALDAGTLTGWMRTGRTIQVFNTGDSRLANSIAVCRFYGNPARGLDSHFYSATPQECDEVKQKFPDAWLLETDEAFRVHRVSASTGQCPANTKPVYRLYNGRADVNHRYTTDQAVVAEMLAKGYSLEGTGGPPPIVFCAANIAAAQPAAGSPQCTITPDVPYPSLGTPLTLTAACTGSPTAIAWLGCAGHGSACTTTATQAGNVTYGVVATNGSGPGTTATITLNWQPPADAPPSCSVTASSTAPQIGFPLALTAQCTGVVAKYEWLACSPLTPDACVPLSECAAATTSCSPIGQQQGTILYALRATNAAGTAPKASVSVNWVGGTQPPPTGTVPVCTLTASSTSPAVGTTLTLTAACTNAPTAYQWTGCNSTSNVCVTSEATVGTRTYWVNGRNAAGVGPAATIQVDWNVPPTAPPTCTLSANPAQPFAGGTSTLTATCTQSPTSYNWTNCTPLTGNTCRAASATTGMQSYSVTATNALGTSPPVSITLDWQTPPPGGADLCGNFPNVKRVNLVWGGFIDTNDPGGGFEDDAILVGRFTVPANASGTTVPGTISVVEHNGPPVQRIMTLSPSSCDFRGFTPNVFPPTDSTGSTAPLAWGFGINPSAQFALTGMPGGAPKLVPGQTYYVNVRNRDFTTGSATCQVAECNVRVTVNRPN